MLIPPNVFLKLNKQYELLSTVFPIWSELYYMIHHQNTYKCKLSMKTKNVCKKTTERTHKQNNQEKTHERIIYPDNIKQTVQHFSKFSITLHKNPTVVILSRESSFQENPLAVTHPFQSEGYQTRRACRDNILTNDCSHSHFPEGPSTLRDEVTPPKGGSGGVGTAARLAKKLSNAVSSLRSTRSSSDLWTERESRRGGAVEMDGVGGNPFRILWFELCLFWHKKRIFWRTHSGWTYYGHVKIWPNVRGGGAGIRVIFFSDYRGKIWVQKMVQYHNNLGKTFQKSRNWKLFTNNRIR